MPSLTKTFYYNCIACLFILPATLKAQTIENTINSYGQNFPQERIHIHFDKESYLPGETIWFKAYVFEEYQPSARSTNFYASLYDADGKLIQQQLCPIFGGTASGHFQIPDSLQSKQLICRAFTAWMLNFDTTFFFTKAIKLINNDAKDAIIQKDKTVSLQFFPEGGDIIDGTKNTIAFKANYNDGFPFEINGVLKKQSTGQVMMPIKSVHDGMGKFDIDIYADEKFYVEWKDAKDIIRRSYLPVSKTSGVSLKLVQQKGNIIFNIINKLPNDSLHVLMYMYQKVFYKKDFSVSAAEPYTSNVAANTLPTGIMQITVFDANWQPVAERVAFINNNNYQLAASINNKETNIIKRGKNTIEIAMSDTIATNMSLSITDADLNSDATNSTIVTDLLLNGDVKGYINNPAYYFSDATDAKSNLDLVMLTNGWRRYNWDNMLAAKMPEIKYPVDNYLTAYGQVSKAAMKGLDKEELVNLIVKTKDSTQNFYFIKPNADGTLKQDGLIFYDTARILYSLNKNRILNPQLALGNFNATYLQRILINNSNSFSLPDTIGISFNQRASMFQYYIRDKVRQEFNKEKTLQAVLVKSGGWHNWKNDPIFKMNERYADFAFKIGSTDWAFDVMHDEMSASKSDIYNYMIGKVPELGLAYPPGGKKLYAKHNPAGLLLFLNEVEIENDDLTRINMEDVAFIKYIERFAARPGLPAALSIYLKKGDDLIDRTPKDWDVKEVKIPGYSPIKEFYSPDYSQSNTTTGTDARTTLLWQPYILTDKSNLKIPITFYNSDFSKRLRIVLEGINEDGKMIHLEKILE